MTGSATAAGLPRMADPARLAALGLSDPADVLAGVESAVRRYCGWHVGPVISDQQWIDSPGGYDLQLPTLALVEITGITDSAGADVDLAHVSWSRTGTVRT